MVLALASHFRLLPRFAIGSTGDACSRRAPLGAQHADAAAAQGSALNRVLSRWKSRNACGRALRLFPIGAHQTDRSYLSSSRLASVAARRG